MLELFAPHADLLRGHDGGLNKSGTLEGVRTLAGFADTSSHGRVRFVISLESDDGEMRFRLLRAIESGLKQEFHLLPRDPPHAGDNAHCRSPAVATWAPPASPR